MALALRQIIPTVTMRALHATAQQVGAPLAEGRVVRAWDYKQKRALVIAFLHAECGACSEWVASLRAAAQVLREWDATALVVFSGAPDTRLFEGVPANIVMGVDVTGRSVRAFLGNAALDRAGQTKVGVFVTDRYGELHAQWLDGDGAGHQPLPAVEDVLGWVAQVQIACG